VCEEPWVELEAGSKTCQKRQASGSVEWEGVPGEDEVEFPQRQRRVATGRRLAEGPLTSA